MKIPLLLLLTSLPLWAASADYKQILITGHDSFVEVRLPLTDVTGPARVKQRADDGFGIPIAPSRTELGPDCYIEWQISYDTPCLTHPSIVPDVRFQRDSRTKYGCELTKLILDALHQRVLTTAELRQLRAELDTLRAVDLEASEKVALHAEATRTPGVPEGFERFTQKVPQWVRSTLAGSVEIQFKPKQRAVGSQPMVYVCLPSKTWRRADGQPRIAGHARVKETVHVRLGREERDLLLAIVRAFGVASREHNEDLTKILDALLAQS